MLRYHLAINEPVAFTVGGMRRDFRYGDVRRPGRTHGLAPGL